MRITMKTIFKLALTVAAVMSMSSCATIKKSRGDYHAEAYRPQNRADVKVKISLKNQALYVTEGDRALLVTAACIGKPSTPTPKGNWRILSKTKYRRRRSQPGRGYPMGYWCAFYSPAYGIHQGWVHPYPRSQGCVRIHHNVAPKFFELVRVGTPVIVRDSFPEDATIGKNIDRPTDYGDPEWPAHILKTNKVFQLYKGPIFADGPAPKIPRS